MYTLVLHNPSFLATSPRVQLCLLLWVAHWPHRPSWTAAQLYTVSVAASLRMGQNFFPTNLFHQKERHFHKALEDFPKVPTGWTLVTVAQERLGMVGWCFQTPFWVIPFLLGSRGLR